MPGQLGESDDRCRKSISSVNGVVTEVGAEGSMGRPEIKMC